MLKPEALSSNPMSRISQLAHSESIFRHLALTPEIWVSVLRLRIFKTWSLKCLKTRPCSSGFGVEWAALASLQTSAN